MRIVGGTLKGRTLVPFNEQNIRPTSDMVRESLFNILQGEISGSKFLDLFAGTGAMGIEAYSRGADKVVFCDLSKDSVSVIMKNLSKCKIDGDKKIQVLLTDSVDYVKRAEKFDVVFIDPPYKSNLITELSPHLFNLIDDGIIIIESEKPLTESIEGLCVFDTRKYGRAHLTFYKKEK